MRAAGGTALFALTLTWAAACGREAPPQAVAPPVTAATAPDEASPPPAAEQGAAPASAPTASIRTQPWLGDFDGMVERRRLRALVVYSKTAYYVENGQPRGASYEALTALEDQINKKLGNKNVKFHVVFVPTSRDDLIPALVEGRGDLAAAMLTITPERQKQVDFSRPLWSGVDEIAVTGPASPALSTVDDLSGKEVFVRRSSAYWENLEALNKRFTAAGKQPMTLVAAPEDLEDEDLLEMLNAGAFGIAVVDKPIAELWAKIYPDIRVHPEIAVASGGQIGWMVRKNSPKLKAELDAFVATHGQGTLFGNTIMQRYVGSTKLVKRATSPDEIKKFRQLADLFKRYGEKYNVDFLLAMAQGYQESRLDQSVKSPVGAVGIMQIMPKTGAELATGDIKQVEPNVHAGVKYIRFMIDEYFAGEPMTPLNKGLMAFAAYNCGPGRLRGLRKEAQARGLDPNVWFNNVELVAADKIGAETVTYVSNIYKYYIAYKLIAERAQARDAAKAAPAPH